MDGPTSSARAKPTTSISQMIERFRKSEPTSRSERAARKEKGMLRELWFEGSDAGPGAGGAYGRGGRRGGGLSNTLAVTPQRGRKSRNRYGDENGRERERVDRRSRDRSARDVRDWDRGGGERYSRSDRDRDRDARDYRDRDSGRSRWSNRTDGSRPLRNDRSRSSADKLPLELLTESGYEIGGGMRYSQNFGAQPGIMNTSMNASLNMSASYGSMGQMGIGSRGMDLNDGDMNVWWHWALRGQRGD